MFQTVKTWLVGQRGSVYKDSVNTNPTNNHTSAQFENHDPFVGAFALAKKLGSQVCRTVVKSSENAATFVGKVPIFRDFQRLQDNFTAEQLAEITNGTEYEPGSQSVLLPWDPDFAGITDQTLLDKIRSRIFELSKHPNTFLLPPPIEAHMGNEVFESSDNIRLAQALLEEDPNLSKMRYLLVPARVKEELFWRNYFYRVSIVRQSFQLSTLAGSDSEEFVCVTGEIDRCQTEPDEVNQDSLVNKVLTTATNMDKSAYHGSHELHEITEPFELSTNSTPESASKYVPHCIESINFNELTTDELLEAELAREANDVVLIDTQTDQLDQELEMEILAELERHQKST